MSKELKYRVWDAENKAMIYFTLDDVIAEMASGGAGDWTEEEILGRELARLQRIFDKSPKMEFIGLTDKYGKDVYQGDLVKAILINEYSQHEEVIEEVKIQDGFLAPFYMRVCYEQEWWKDRLLDGFEVIGNIWEHKDLQQ